MVTLIKDYEVCKEGDVLTPEQAKILELLDYKLAAMKFKLKACWIKGEGFENLDSKEEGNENDPDEMEQDDSEDEWYTKK